MRFRHFTSRFSSVQIKQGLQTEVHNLDLVFFFSSVQVARGLVLPLTVIITYLAYKKLPGKLALVSCGIVTLGFFIGILYGGGAASVSRCVIFPLSPLLFFSLLIPATCSSPLAGWESCSVS